MKAIIRRIERINYLICSRRTGTPSQFAEKLELSESTLYNYLRALRELGAPIAYDKHRQTYYFEAYGKIKICFEEVEPVGEKQNVK